MTRHLDAHVEENMHLQQRQALGPLDPTNPGYWGYIQAVQVADGTATIVNPQNSDIDTNLADPNDPVLPVVSAPIPVCSGFASLSGANGRNNPIRDDIQTYGIQLVPFGGATTQNFQTGEQVLVLNLNSDFGEGACIAFGFNDNAQAPGSQPIPVSGVMLALGEWLYVHPAGIIQHFDALGNLHLYTIPIPDADPNTSGNIITISQGGVSLQATANPVLDNPLQYTVNIDADVAVNIESLGAVNVIAPLVTVTATTVNITGTTVVNVTSTGTINATAPIFNALDGQVNLGAGPLLTLCNSLFFLWAAGHTHDGVAPGVGTSLGPTVPPPIGGTTVNTVAS